MEKLQIIQDSENISTQDLAKLYIQVFGVEPRNEGYTDSDGNLYPLDIDKKIISEKNLKPFYDPAQVETQWQNTRQKEGYKGFLVTDGLGFLGFILGWMTSLENLNNEKLQLENDKLQNLKKNIENLAGREISQDEKMFYLSELGTSQSIRGKGFGKKLFETLSQNVKSEISILRTTSSTPVPYQTIFGAGGYEIVENYNDLQKRIIMAKIK